MIVDFNTGTWLMALFIISLVIYLAATGRLPRRDGEINRLRKLEAQMSYLQDEDLRKGQLIAKLTQENTELRQKVSFLEGQLSKLVATVNPRDRSLLIAVGSDPALSIDIAALRGARGLQLTTLLPATYQNLKTTLERHLRTGNPDEGVHFAVHASEEGIMLDRLVTRAELSALLRGTQVCVLMGCTSAEIGDLLTVVPTVVAFNKAVPHDEAWQFSLLFWKAYGDGLSAAAAFAQARERGPTLIGEAAELIEV